MMMMMMGMNVGDSCGESLLLSLASTVGIIGR